MIIQSFHLALPTVDCDVSGTALGDPIEVGAQEKIYGKDRSSHMSGSDLSSDSRFCTFGGIEFDIHLCV